MKSKQQLVESTATQEERPAVPKVRKASPSRFRLLPLTLMMMVLMLGVRSVDLYQNGMKLRDRIKFPEAYAEDAKPEDASKEEDKSESKEGEAAAKDESAADVKKAEEPAKEGAETSAESSGEGESPDDVKLAKLSDEPGLKTDERQREFTPIELDILQSLVERRDALETKKREVDLKEKLLQATEMRINDKIAEIKRLKEEMQELLKEYNKAEDSKVKGLVKIYENMKPKDAAQIFNELEMPILLEVIDQMSARKVAPVLANMDPIRAKDVTRELAEFRKLRELPRAAELGQ